MDALPQTIPCIVVFLFSNFNKNSNIIQKKMHEYSVSKVV